MTRIVVGYDGGEQSHDALALGSVARGVDRRERDPATTFPHLLPRVDDEGSTTAFAPESDSIAGAFATSRAARARISSSWARPTVAPWAACFRAASVSCCSTTRPARWRSRHVATRTGSRNHLASSASHSTPPRRRGALCDSPRSSPALHQRCGACSASSSPSSSATSHTGRRRRNRTRASVGKPWRRSWTA